MVTDTYFEEYPDHKAVAQGNKVGRYVALMRVPLYQDAERYSNPFTCCVWCCSAWRSCWCPLVPLLPTLAAVQVLQDDRQEGGGAEPRRFEGLKSVTTLRSFPQHPPPCPVHAPQPHPHLTQPTKPPNPTSDPPQTPQPPHSPPTHPQPAHYCPPRLPS